MKGTLFYAMEKYGLQIKSVLNLPYHSLDFHENSNAHRIFVCFIGFQTTIPYCVRQSDKATVADEYCEASEKPTVITKSCNAKACPKEYEYKAIFKECSVTCAKGLFF